MLNEKRSRSAIFSVIRVEKIVIEQKTSFLQRNQSSTKNLEGDLVGRTQSGGSSQRI